MANVEFQPIAQMTIKSVGGTPKDAIKLEKSVFVCKIWGEATDVIQKENRSGDMYTYLIGAFRALNKENKGFEASKLFLPGSLQELIEGQVKTSAGKPVQFGFEIYANPDDTTATGYRYAAKPIVKTAAIDHLEEMTANVLAGEGVTMGGGAKATEPATESTTQSTKKKK